jgi:hypothetical protein
MEERQVPRPDIKITSLVIGADTIGTSKLHSPMSADPFTEHSLLLAGLGAEIAGVGFNIETVIDQLRAKVATIARLEQEISANQARNDFLLSEIVKSGEDSAVVLLNALWGLTGETHNRLKLGANDALLQHLLDQLQISRITPVLRPIAGILANLCCVAETCERCGNRVLDAVCTSEPAADPAYNHLAVVLLYNLSFCQSVAQNIRQNFTQLCWYLRRMMERTRKSAELTAKLAKLMRQLVWISQEGGIFDENREQLIVIYQIAGIGGRVDPNASALARELGCES